MISDMAFSLILSSPLALKTRRVWRRAADHGTRESLQLATVVRNRADSPGPQRLTIARMEGRLRRVAGTWVGELHGYHVHIANHVDGWCVWLMPGGAWTERVLRADSLADAAKLARAWIEERLRIKGPSDGQAVAGQSD